MTEANIPRTLSGCHDDVVSFENNEQPTKRSRKDDSCVIPLDPDLEVPLMGQIDVLSEQICNAILYQDLYESCSDLFANVMQFNLPAINTIQSYLWKAEDMTSKETVEAYLCYRCMMRQVTVTFFKDAGCTQWMDNFQTDDAGSTAMYILTRTLGTSPLTAPWAPFAHVPRHIRYARECVTKQITLHAEAQADAEAIIIGSESE